MLMKILKLLQAEQHFNSMYHWVTSESNVFHRFASYLYLILQTYSLFIGGKSGWKIDFENGISVLCCYKGISVHCIVTSNDKILIYIRFQSCQLIFRSFVYVCIIEFWCILNITLSLFCIRDTTLIKEKFEMKTALSTAIFRSNSFIYCFSYYKDLSSRWN